VVTVNVKEQIAVLIAAALRAYGDGPDPISCDLRGAETQPNIPAALGSGGAAPDLVAKYEQSGGFRWLPSA